MIIDLKKDTIFRGLAFEVLAQRFLRRINKNNFIFTANRFAGFEELVGYYKLNLVNIQNTNLIKEYYRSIDIIEFELNDTQTKVVKSLTLYEVKSKIETRKRPIDITKTCYSRFERLNKAGFNTKLVMINLFSHWRFSINIFDYLSFNNIRLRENRFEMINK